MLSKLRFFGSLLGVNSKTSEVSARKFAAARPLLNRQGIFYGKPTPKDSEIKPELLNAFGKNQIPSKAYELQDVGDTYLPQNIRGKVTELYDVENVESIQLEPIAFRK